MRANKCVKVGALYLSTLQNCPLIGTESRLDKHSASALTASAGNGLMALLMRALPGAPPSGLPRRSRFAPGESVRPTFDNA
ncbi:hypothetical protein HW44_01740 [Nitrosococcus oceani]|nr:hypothetical protein HW44_01740 [Nitrosococcus oceani]